MVKFRARALWNIIKYLSVDKCPHFIWLLGNCPPGNCLTLMLSGHPGSCVIIYV